MNLSFFKIISTIICLLLSIFINYFSFYKKNTKNFETAILIIIASSIVFYVLDLFIFKNIITDYLAFIMLLSFLLSITFEDIKTNLMDNRVILFYFILFLIYRIIFLDLSIFLEGVLGFVLSFVLLIIPYLIKRDLIGFGDIEAISACGMIIGFPNIFHFLFKTFLFVFIYGLYLMITKKKENMKEIPLAPFLLLATIF